MSLADPAVDRKARTVPAPPARCFLCGSTRGPVLFREAGYAARQCGCGILLADPRPPASMDPAQAPHLAAFRDLPSGVKLDWLEQFRRGGTFVEVGPGDGVVAEAAMRRGWHVQAIEPHPGQAARLRERLGIHVETAFVEDTAQPDRSADVVYHCDLLGRFPDPILALNRMRRLLRPSGVLFFEVGLVADLAPAWYRLMATIRMPAHRWFYTRNSLASALDRAGLEIAAMRRFGLAPAVLLARLAHLMGSAGGTPAPPDHDRRGAPARHGPAGARIQDFMRYRIGALAAGVGPETALVIARPKEGA